MKKMTAIGIMMLTVMLTGCAPVMPDMTEEQSALVTQYAANLLIKYNDLPGRSLLSDDQLAKEEAKEEAAKEKERKKQEAAEAYLAAQESAKEKDSSSTAVQQETNQIDNLASFYELNDFSIQYSSYELCASYPDESRDDYFLAMDATEGKQLCIVKFSVTNMESADSDFDMFYKKPNFYLSLEGGDKIPVQSTLLLDDLASYKGMISGGASQEMVLVFEIPDSITEISSMTLTVKYGSQKGILTLQ